MSLYATPFLLFNLGSEMLFVVSQRLQAQNICQERAAHVLDEIASSLLDQQMIAELVKAQEPMNHANMKQLLSDIAQSSIMRLDPVSMDRLWDLVTMVFKWQVTVAQDIVAVTARHLYEIETFTTNPDTQLQLHRVQNIVDNFSKILTPEDKVALRGRILLWLQHFNIRVSLLLRLGFQNEDATFKMNDFNPEFASMLENVGENIFAVTKNYNLAKAEENLKAKAKSENYELNAMINQILGDNNQNTDPKEPAQYFKLSLCDKYEESETGENNRTENMNYFSEIQVSNSTNKIQDLFSDVNTTEDVPITDLHDELLNIIDETC